MGLCLIPTEGPGSKHPAKWHVEDVSYEAANLWALCRKVDCHLVTGRESLGVYGWGAGWEQGQGYLDQFLIFWNISPGPSLPPSWPIFIRGMVVLSSCCVGVGYEESTILYVDKLSQDSAWIWRIFQFKPSLLASIPQKNKPWQPVFCLLSCFSFQTERLPLTLHLCLGVANHHSWAWAGWNRGHSKVERLPLPWRSHRFRVVFEAHLASGQMREGFGDLRQKEEDAAMTPGWFLAEEDDNFFDLRLRCGMIKNQDAFETLNFKGIQAHESLDKVLLIGISVIFIEDTRSIPPKDIPILTVLVGVGLLFQEDSKIEAWSLRWSSG